MKAKELIESGLLELYVLGQCTDEETRIVEAHLDNDAVSAELQEIEESMLTIADHAAINPSPSLRSKIFDAIDAEEGNSTARSSKDTKVVSMKPEKATATQWWLRAAVIALLVSLGANGFFAPHNGP